MGEERKEEVKAAEQPENANLVKELERIRGRHRVLKIAVLLLSMFFMAVLLAAAFIYHKIAAFREMFAGGENPFSQSVPEGRNWPAAGLPAPPFSGLSLSTQAAGSSLMMPTGIGLPSAEATGAGPYAGGYYVPAAADGAKIMQAISKYADRPIVRDFMEEIKKDPDFRRALKEKDADNPLAMISSLAKTKGLEKLAVKFAMRSDFMPLMMEMMNDPQMKPLMSQFPGYNAGAVTLTPARTSGLQSAPASVQAVSGSRDANGNAGFSVDSSPLGGAQKAQSQPLKKNAPPPISE